MTTIAIHQPNFFPWVGFFDKIVNCDVFVFMDDVQYSTGTMTNRTYMIDQVGKYYVTCPVSYNHPTKIKDVLIANVAWKQKLIRTIKYKYDESNIRRKIIGIIQNDELNLCNYNIFNIYELCDVMGITPRKFCMRQSHLTEFKSKNTNLIIDIIKYLGGDTYYTGVGAKLYLDEQKVKEAGIQIQYQDITGFPPTSIIDVLLTKGIAGTKELFH